MKKKKIFLFTPIIYLSLFLILLVSLINLIPKHQPIPITSSNFSSIPKSSFFSLLTLTSRPTSHFSPSTSIIAVGDIMLGRYCNVQMLKNNDWKYPFLKTASFTSSADITFGNLEAPIVENCPTTETGMIFCTQPQSIEGLKFAGFDILSLANNHILNFGQDGLDQTKKFLSSSNILYSPLTSSNPSSINRDNNLTIQQFNNVKFGFLSFDLVTYPNQLTLLHNRVIKSTNEADVLIVSLHWGNEYQKTPNQQQKDLAHQIIDSGAKIIIGHHPHVTQPMEKYNGGLIFYSLGNFVFDQPWSEETKKGQIAKIIFEGKEIKSYELIPIHIENYCQPKLLQ